MAEHRSQRRVRLALTWTLSACLLCGYALMEEGDPDDKPTLPGQAAACVEGAELDIVQVDPGEPTPGSAVEISYVCAATEDRLPVRALLSAPAGSPTAVKELEVLRGGSGRTVARIPNDARAGRRELRIAQGERRSKPYDVRVKGLNRKKLFRSAIGGLALLVFGLGMMASGSRTYMGLRGHRLMAGIGRRMWAAMGLGVAVGGIAQFTSTAAGVVVGLIQSHLMRVGTGVAILLGAQLGSATMPALLGWASTAREGLLVVTIGVLWLSLAGDRRGKAIGKILLGCGLLFYGLHLLRIGFEPLVSDPELLPYIDGLQADSMGGLGACVAAGILLSALLQGPGPVFALVLGLSQASGRVDLQSSLAILAGTGLGAAVAAAVVAWPFGREPRRLAIVYFGMSLLGTFVLAGTVDLWAFVADSLVSGTPHEVAYGKKVLMPNIGRHLVTGFVLSQATMTLLVMSVLPLVVRWTSRLKTPLLRPRAEPPSGAMAVGILRQGLVRTLGHHRAALAAIVDLCLSARRERSVQAEHELADGRAELEAMFSSALRTRSDAPDLMRLRQAALAAMQMQRSIDDLLRHGDQTTVRAMALSADGERWQPGPSDTARIKLLHELLMEGLDLLVKQLQAGAMPDIDTARSREIRLNALEMETRQGLLVGAERDEGSGLIALRLTNTDLVNAYETVGNHLYRLCEALASEVEQDASQAV